MGLQRTIIRHCYTHLRPTLTQKNLQPPHTSYKKSNKKFFVQWKKDKLTFFESLIFYLYIFYGMLEMVLTGLFHAYHNNVGQRPFLGLGRGACRGRGRGWGNLILTRKCKYIICVVLCKQERLIHWFSRTYSWFHIKGTLIQWRLSIYPWGLR